MDIRKVKKLIELLEESGIAELEISEGEESVRISRQPPAQAYLPAPAPVAIQPLAAPAPPPRAAAPASAEPPKAADNRHVVRAPMVGTFYLRPSPDQPPFVAVGDVVQATDTVCLVEVMKMFNSVKAGVAGTIERILIDAGKTVQHDQILMLIKPAKEA